MKHATLLVGLLATVLGCQTAATRAWQSTDMPSHDRDRVFNAAKEVFESHFGAAEANWAKGTIETRPQIFDRARSGTLADIRGAGGQWRRTASFEMDREGLAVVARVAVRLEREATAAAAAAADTMRPERNDESARPMPPRIGPSRTRSDEVWMEVGYDAAMARELLAEIAQRVGEAERGEAVPQGPSPKDEAEESRRIGAEQDTK